MTRHTRLFRPATDERIPTLARIVLLAVAFMALMPVPAFAADLDGAWAINTAYCSKVFVKNGNKVSFTTDADLYGGGLIVDGNQATGTFQKCKIKSMKNDGTAVRMTATCSDGVMVEEAQLTVKIVGPDKISLSVDKLDMQEGNPFERCRL